MSPFANRRNLLFAAGCVAAVGIAEALKPRREMSLLAGRKLDDVIPRQLTGWTSLDVTNLVAPREEGSLASRIYSQTVGRVYTQTATGQQVMLLAAHGDTQSRDLQLHRPESCYPAVGFTIAANSTAETPVGRASLPTRRLIADAPGRRELIVYWSRLGEYVPVGGMEQRLDVLRTALSGYVADGLLMRVSTVGVADPKGLFGMLDGFIDTLVASAGPDQRPVMVGHQLARAVG